MKDRAMNEPLMKMRAWVIAARVHQRLGATGLVGLVCLAAAALVFGTAWRAQQRDGASIAQPSPAIELPMPAAARPVRLPLPSNAEIPVLLARIQRSALEQGLGWPRAEYRSNAPSEDAPASFEVHCVLKGPYPNVRRFVTALLQDAPTLTLREFSLSRANADAPEVEAKLTFVIYLASGARQ